MFIKKGVEYVSWSNDHVRVVTVITNEDKTKTVVVANLKSPGGKSSIAFPEFCDKYTEKLPLLPVTTKVLKPKTDPKQDRNGWTELAQLEAATKI